MDALLTSTYGTKSIDGVLSPNDTLARAIITSVNGVKIVPAFLLPPVIVTKANAAAAYANDPVLSLLTK